MRLVACGSCHTQFDVTSVDEKEFSCRCGETVENRPLQAVEAEIHRCGSCGALVAIEATDCAYCGSAIVRDRDRLSLICPECYGRNADDARFCGVCGVHFEPQGVGTNTEELPCPVCGCLMPPRVVGKVGISECPQCNGLWVPGNRFDALIDRAVEARRERDPQKLAHDRPRTTGGNPVSHGVRYRKCPVCEAFMHRRNWMKTSGVVIDRCNEHGTWLDADELEQIAGFVQNGGLERSREQGVERRRADGDGERVSEALARVQIEMARHGGDRVGENKGLGGILAGFLDELLK